MIVSEFFCVFFLVRFAAEEALPGPGQCFGERKMQPAFGAFDHALCIGGRGRRLTVAVTGLSLLARLRGRVPAPRQVNQQGPEQIFQAPPRCSTTSSTKRLPT